MVAWAKYAHNYLSFPFTLGVVLMFLMWIGGQYPEPVDVEWLKRRRRHVRQQTIRQPIASTPARSRSTGSSSSAARR